MCTIHTNLIYKYFPSLDEFCSSINEHYEKKEEIKTNCKKIKYKLTYTAPEIINNVFAERIKGIIPLLPKEENDWSQKAWQILLKCHKECHEILQKHKSN